MSVWTVTFISLLVGNFTLEQIDTNYKVYKRALDSACESAVSHRTYNTKEFVENVSQGFGKGSNHRSNIYIDKDESLKWFYRLFFMNIGIDHRDDLKTEYKKYIPLKAIIGYDSMYIAGYNDKWIEYKYQIEHSGSYYYFTLSDQVYSVDSDSWTTTRSLGINNTKREILVNEYINKALNEFLNSRDVLHTDSYYNIEIGTSDENTITSDIDGVSFIVVVEGMPIPSMSPIALKKDKFFSISMAGSEVSR